MSASLDLSSSRTSSLTNPAPDRAGEDAMVRFSISPGKPQATGCGRRSTMPVRRRAHGLAATRKLAAALVIRDILQTRAGRDPAARAAAFCEGGLGMRVLETATYRGPHLYAARPMVRIQLDLGQLEAWPTSRLHGFTDHLMVALPGLESHGCSYQAPGGLVLRMRDGTWLGHVIEHVALELQTLAGARSTAARRARSSGRPGVYNILYAYEGEGLGRAAGRAAIELVHSLLPRDLQGVEGLDGSRPPSATWRPAAVRPAARSSICGRSPGARRSARRPAPWSKARRRGIPVQRLDEQSLVQLGWGARRKLIRASITGETSTSPSRRPATRP
jgi:hypothetical protein